MAKPDKALETRWLPGVGALPREDWERMLPGEGENWDFYAAAEALAPPGFTLGAVGAYAAGRLVAAAPTFSVAYRLDTPLQGRVRELTDWVFRKAPRLISLPVVGLGSPLSDSCHLGFAPELGKDARCAAVSSLLAALRDKARAQRSGLLAVKSLSDEHAALFAPSFDEHGFAAVTNVPVVKLHLPFRDARSYLADLPGRQRSYLMRKVRPAPQLRIEFVPSLGPMLAEKIFALFQATLQQSKVDYGEFEQLSPGYFSTLLERMGERAQMMLCWQGDELLSFQLFLVGEDIVVAKHIGMKYPEGRDLNLYFVNWMKLIEFAIAHRIPSVDMGATTYAAKLLFGGELERKWLHFRFRGDIWNRALRPLAPFFDFERNDPELKALRTGRRQAGACA